MDVASWLRSLGLEQYEAAFRENAITEKLLPSLTAEDLKDLGVSIVGHRRALLNAIADLSSSTHALQAPSAAMETVTAPGKDTAAERRQVTVMFSDLVGSTALSARMDPEDLREVISAYQKCVAETVGRFGGFVAKYMGDGVLVYFGYPQAHEDDAERAVRAGLELVAAVSGLKTHAPLQTRVGIATGLVVVGDLIGSGASQEQAIVGETPNLAARLQGIAEPNIVVIAESTRRLIGDLFELEDLGAQDLKGIAGPARAWAALRPASVEGRFEAFHTSRLTDLVGREEELELLLRRWPKAKTGEGQVVLLSGEAGIGKSRLTAALLERLADEPHTRLRYFCSPQHTDSAFYPIISQMQRAAGLAHDDTAQAKLDKLDTVLAQSSTPRQHAALFAEMLSLPDDGRYPKLELAPQQRRQKTLEALTAQLEALSQPNPVLMIFEDAHLPPKKDGFLMEMKPGFKATEVGMIPEEWKITTIQELLDRGAVVGHLDGNHGELYPRTNEFKEFGVPYITANDLRGHKVSFTKCKYLSEERARRFRKGVARNGDVLFAHNATVGPTALLSTELDFVILSTTATYFRCNPEKLLNSFFLYALQSPQFVSQYQAVMAQSTRNQVPITAQRKLSVVIPPAKAEQEAIAEALSDADALIESLEQLLVKKRHVKQGAMQELLTGKKRLPGFSGQWDMKRLGQLADIRSGGRRCPMVHPNGCHYLKWFQISERHKSNDFAPWAAIQFG